MDNTPKFVFPSHHDDYTADQYNTEHWEQAVESYRNNNYIETFNSFIKIFPTVPIETKQEDGYQKYIFWDGLCFPEIWINDTSYVIRTDIGKIPDKNKVPLLRTCAEANDGTLIMSEVLLKEDLLYIHYEAPVALCDPQKLYDTFEEQSLWANLVLSDFAEKFKISYIRSPYKNAIGDPERNLAWESFIQNLEYLESFLSYYEVRRDMYAILEITYIFLCWMFIYNHIGLKMNAQLSEYIDLLVEGDYTLQEKVTKIKHFFKELKLITKEDYIHDMFDIGSTIITDSYVEDESIPGIIEAYYETAQERAQSGLYESSTRIGMVGLCRLVYSYTLTPIMYNNISEIFSKVSDLKWKEANEILLNFYNSLFEHKS